MANKENQRPFSPVPLLSSISPTNKPSLNRQRDHSACRRPETPLKVRKTRENLKQQSLYADIPPPCIHALGNDEQQDCPVAKPNSAGFEDINISASGHHTQGEHNQVTYKAEVQDYSALLTAPQCSALQIQRQKSVSRRMLSKVKQGITSRSRGLPSVRPTESETSLVRRLSGRQRQSSDGERRSQSFEVGRLSVESSINEAPEAFSLAAICVPRSFTGSTVSTAEILGDSAVLETLKPEAGTHEAEPNRNELQHSISSPPLPSSPSPQMTPRPPPKQQLVPGLQPSQAHISLVVPCVDLYIALDHSTVDVHSKRDVWVAIEATIRSMSIDNYLARACKPSVDRITSFEHHLSDQIKPSAWSCDDADSARDARSHSIYGTVSSLRLCYRPVEGCQIRAIVGQKAMKDLTIGEQCSLFIKLRVPKIRVRDSTDDLDQKSLFTELESIVGTLKTEVLHVEARYRHTMLPSDNVVSVRQICKMKRPKMESRWSVSTPTKDTERTTEVNMMLARYLASQYEVPKALELLQGYLGTEAAEQPALRQIFVSSDRDSQHQLTKCVGGVKPSVVVTDIDLNLDQLRTPLSECSSKVPSVPIELGDTTSYARASCDTDDKDRANGLSLAAYKATAPPLIPAPKPTTALNSKESPPTAILASKFHMCIESQDSARQLWRHIRRTSLSAKQLEDMTPERLHLLEAGDGVLRELRQKALANKRSVGAETLRAWKWDENALTRSNYGEAPWM